MEVLVEGVMNVIKKGRFILELFGEPCVILSQPSTFQFKKIRYLVGNFVKNSVSRSFCHEHLLMKTTISNTNFKFLPQKQFLGSNSLSRDIRYSANSQRNPLMYEAT